MKYFFFFFSKGEYKIELWGSSAGRITSYLIKEGCHDGYVSGDMSTTEARFFFFFFFLELQELIVRDVQPDLVDIIADIMVQMMM